MIEVTRQRKLHPGRTIFGLAAFLMICMFILVGCSGTPTDHPLLTGTPTAGQDTPGVVTGQKSGDIPIAVIDGQSTLTMYPGGYMTLTVQTSPYAVCNFLVSYGLSKPSKTFGIVPRTADANGMVNWHWQVENGAHTGSWPLALSATLPGGAQGTAKISVVVTLAPISVLTSQSILSAPPKGTITITIGTAPSVSCTLIWNYGPGTLTKTYKAQADGKGLAHWSWHVDRSAPAGTWTETITATLADGETSSSTVNITIS
jgi:hypothetical protein